MCLGQFQRRTIFVTLTNARQRPPRLNDLHGEMTRDTTCSITVIIGRMFRPAQFRRLRSDDFADHLPNTVAKMVRKNGSGFHRPNLLKCFAKIRFRYRWSSGQRVSTNRLCERQTILPNGRTSLNSQQLKGHFPRNRRLQL